MTVLASVVLLLLCESLMGATVPSGFRTETIAEGINAGTALAATPDGKIYFAEQTGHIRVVEDGVVQERPLLDLSGKVETHWEAGLIGFQIDPASPHLYVVYVAKEPFMHHVVSRFLIDGERVDPASETILLEGDDQATLGGRVRGAHQGGPIRLGPDGMLYIGIGEQTEDAASQSLKTLQGKILRIHPDGSIPEDNPFYDSLEGKYRSIYALGIRNPFGLAFQPETGRLFEADIGKSSFDEINEIHKGHNYGWPQAEGMSEIPGLTNPIYAYPPAIGRSICGSAFYPEHGSFPEPWKGKLFFADWADHWVKAIDVDHPETVLDFGTGFSNPVAIEVAADGALWVLNRGTRWRDGKVFKNNSGSLTRISYVGGEYTENESFTFPQSLSEAGILGRVKPFRPTESFTRFEMALPLWRPGVQASHWVRMPSGGKIVRVTDSEWVFPEGAQIVQHFENKMGNSHETHLYQSNGDGTFKASAYRWTARSRDASIIGQSEFLPLPWDESTMWLSPGPVARLDPKTAIFGFQPQFHALQLNVGGQLLEWSKRGWFKKPLNKSTVASMTKLHSADDQSIPEIERIRSYLEVNCASCHKPGGASRGYFDARIQTPFEEQLILSDQLMAGDMGVVGAKLVTPGEPEKSILYLRLARKDGFRMPPGFISDEDPPILSLLEKWIRDLGTN